MEKNNDKESEKLLVNFHGHLSWAKKVLDNDLNLCLDVVENGISDKLTDYDKFFIQHRLLMDAAIARRLNALFNVLFPDAVEDDISFLSEKEDEDIINNV